VKVAFQLKRRPHVQKEMQTSDAGLKNFASYTDLSNPASYFTLVWRTPLLTSNARLRNSASHASLNNSASRVSYRSEQLRVLTETFASTTNNIRLASTARHAILL